MNDLYTEKYNPQRKKVLQILAEQTESRPSNIDLSLLGLTTYYRKETLEDTLFDKGLFVDNEERAINHEKRKNIFFMPPQIEALSFLSSHSKSIILAPTSFGKTIIVKEHIYLTKPKNVAYIVPTNALAYELEKDLKTNPSFLNYRIFDKVANASSLSNENLFFIGTQEKYLEIQDSFSNIDLFVIDEAYKLEDSTHSQRGYKLSKSFLDTVSSKAKKVILLCPVAKLDGFDQYQFDFFETKFNAVDKKYKECTDEKDFYEELNECVKSEKTILYCSYPGAINDSHNHINQICTPNKDFLASLKKDFHKDWSVVKCYEKGILTHHGQMPKYIQNKMINMFLDDEKYTLLVGTNSISEGINTPTKNIFFHPSVDCQKDKMLLKNTIGRAGRLNCYPLGYIYSTKNLSYLDNIDPVITLSISNDEELEIIKETSNDEKINAFAAKNSIEKDFLINLIRETKMSVVVIDKIMEQLKKDLKYADLSNLPIMAGKAFVEYKHAYIDYVLIKGILQNSYYDQYHVQKDLSSFDSRINYFREKCKDADRFTNSDIVDNYMRFLYSSLDNYVLIIANIAKAIMKSYESWPFGHNVKDSINAFFQKYYLMIYGNPNFEDLSSEEQRIMMALREYGINLTDRIIDTNLIQEINNYLNVRYSTYDIINAIKTISKSNSVYASACGYLVGKYL